MRIALRPGKVVILLGALCGQIVHAQVSGNPHPSKEVLQQADEDLRQAAVDRGLLVEPAGSSYQPEAHGSHVKLVLILESTEVPKGLPIRYRLELVNTGDQDYVFNESYPSFFKSGRLPADRIRLIVNDPRGHEIELVSPRRMSGDVGVHELRFPAEWNEEKRMAWLSAENAHARAGKRLFVELKPGDRLFTRGDSPSDKFRTLGATYRFEKAGRYKIRAELNTRFGKDGIVSKPIEVKIR